MAAVGPPQPNGARRHIRGSLVNSQHPLDRNLLRRGVYLACFLLATIGCVSTSHAPPSLTLERCQPDVDLAGVWISARLGQVGPASMRFRFACDCTYTARIRVALMWIRESGSFWTDEGALHLTRANGTTTIWPYRFEGDTLVLREHETEEHVYVRRHASTCEPPRSAGN